MCKQNPETLTQEEENIVDVLLPAVLPAVLLKEHSGKAFVYQHFHTGVLSPSSATPAEQPGAVKQAR